MIRKLFLTVTLPVILMSGCASTPNDNEVDGTKAAEANATLGVRYMQQGNYDVAMQKLEKALKFDKRHAPAHHYMAELYRRLERYDEADEHFRDALYYSDSDSALHNNYGAFLCSQGRYEDGEEQFRKVLTNPTYPQRAQVYENLGLCVEQIPNHERAEEYLRSALRSNPRSRKSLMAMARITFAKGNYLSTRAYLQRYLEVARHTAESLWLGIRAERLLGDKNAVSSYGLLLKANFPETDEARLYIKSEAGE